MEPNPETPLPAFRIMPLINRTFGPPLPTGQYALVVNWDPQDPSFTLKDKSMKNGEHGKYVSSWKQAYADAVLAILAIEEPLHRKALLRGLTPVPLHLLNASVVATPVRRSGLHRRGVLLVVPRGCVRRVQRRGR